MAIAHLLLAAALLSGPRIVDVSVGGETTCSLDAAGRVACWGCNDSGQRGDAEEACRDTPTHVALPEPAVEVSVGDDRACAVLASGKVACWGSNQWGALGDGVPKHGRSPRAANLVDCSAVPVVVSGVADAAQVSVGDHHVCARRRSGRVACWGMNTYGQLGNGSRAHRATPAAIESVTDAVQIAAGGTFTCALRRRGAVSCWGSNSLRQLGDGRTHGMCAVSRHTTDAFGSVDCSLRPVTAAVTGATRIAAGPTGACAITPGGVACWGAFPGDGARYGVPAPVTLPVARGVVAVAIGEWQACALLASGRVTCWGRADLIERATKSAGVVAVSVGHARACALDAAGALACW